MDKKGKVIDLKKFFEKKGDTKDNSIFAVPIILDAFDVTMLIHNACKSFYKDNEANFNILRGPAPSGEGAFLFCENYLYALAVAQFFLSAEESYECTILTFDDEDDPDDFIVFVEELEVNIGK